MSDLLTILEDDEAFGDFVEEIRTKQRQCTHPNLFGCKGHCVWCGKQIGELRLATVDGVAVQSGLNDVASGK